MFFVYKETEDQDTVLYYKYKGNSYKLKIPFQDTASIENAISCLMALLYFDYDIATINLGCYCCFLWKCEK
jgi:alanine racemase